MSQGDHEHLHDEAKHFFDEARPADFEEWTIVSSSVEKDHGRIHLEVLADKSYSYPYYWAPLILSGAR